MASWPESTRLIGKSIPRLDGLAKASGRAKYPSDIRPEGMLFGVLLTSPHANAKVKALDLEPARAMPGVKGVIALATAGETNVIYQGQEIAAVAAETEEKARDAARDETKACQRNRAGLEASIAAHNRAVDGLKREADARVAESRKAAQAARAVAESHRRNVDRILSERIGPDKCAEAARLIDQYGE